MIFLGVANSSGSYPEWSIGFDDGTNHMCIYRYGDIYENTYHSAIYSLLLLNSSGQHMYGSAAIISKGFRLTIDKSGSGQVMGLYYLVLA
jgi:hypothetical protein